MLLIAGAIFCGIGIRYLAAIKSSGGQRWALRHFAAGTPTSPPAPITSGARTLPDRLEVTHTASASTGLQFFDKTIKDPVAVQRLYNATLRLPKEDTNVKLCLFNPTSISNDLRFFNETDLILHATLVVGGCGSWVRIDGFDRDLAPDDRYFSLLVNSLGVTDRALFAP